MRMEVTFYKDLFDKIGVKADMLQMGDFKGAAEPYTRTSLSEPNRKQLHSVLDDNFDHGLVARIVKAARKTDQRAGQKADRWRSLHREGRSQAKLIDRIAYTDELRGRHQDSAQDRQQDREELRPGQDGRDRPDIVHRHDEAPEPVEAAQVEGAEGRRDLRDGRHQLGQERQEPPRRRHRAARRRSSRRSARRKRTTRSRPSCCASTAPAARRWPAT